MGQGLGSADGMGWGRNDRMTIGWQNDIRMMEWARNDKMMELYRNYDVKMEWVWNERMT